MWQIRAIRPKAGKSGCAPAQCGTTPDSVQGAHIGLVRRRQSGPGAGRLAGRVSCSAHAPVAELEYSDRLSEGLTNTSQDLDLRPAGRTHDP